MSKINCNYVHVTCGGVLQTKASESRYGELASTSQKKAKSL